MELQLDLLPLDVEVQVISAFVFVVIGAEIVAFLAWYHLKYPGSGVAVIRACVIGITTIVAMKAVEFIYLVSHGMEASARAVIHGITLVIVDIGCTALSVAIRHFTRSRPVLHDRAIPILIATNIVALALHVVELASAKPGSIVPDAISFAISTQVGLVPGFFVIFLHAHADQAIKPYYKAIFLALVLLGAAGAIQFLPVENLLVHAGMDLAMAGVASAAFSIAGVSLFFTTLYMMPYIEDVHWRREVVAIYVLNSAKGNVVFNRHFSGPGNVPRALNAIDGSNSSILVEGLSSMEDFIREMTDAAGGNLEFVDKGGIKFVLSRFKQFLFIVIATQNLPIIRAKLLDFKAVFTARLGEEMKGKKGTPLDETMMARLVQVADRLFEGASEP